MSKRMCKHLCQQSLAELVKRKRYTTCSTSKALSLRTVLAFKKQRLILKINDLENQQVFQPSLLNLDILLKARINEHAEVASPSKDWPFLFSFFSEGRFLFLVYYYKTDIPPFFLRQEREFWTTQHIVLLLEFFQYKRKGRCLPEFYWTTTLILSP